MFKSRRIATSGGDKFRNDKSLAFDGTNDYIDCGTTMESTLRGDFTIVAWIRPTDGRTGGVDTIIGSECNSKFELAKIIKDVFELKVDVSSTDKVIINRCLKKLKHKIPIKEQLIDLKHFMHIYNQ